MNNLKIQNEIRNLIKNRELARRKKLSGAVGYCNGAIDMLNKLLYGEFT